MNCGKMWLFHLTNHNLNTLRAVNNDIELKYKTKGKFFFCLKKKLLILECFTTAFHRKMMAVPWSVTEFCYS